MKDIATYRSWRLAAAAAGSILMGLVCLAVVGSLFFFIRSEKASWGVLLVGLFPLALGSGVLTHGVRRARESREQGCFLRAGPEGLALRLPGPAKRRFLCASYDMWEYSFRWDEVTSVTWTLGSDRARSIVIHARGGSLTLEAAWFKEPAAAILDNMRRAAHPVSPPIPKTTL
ncbi:MAG: hypothetical protein HY927_04370 [Elusimicrobia bacterium]|nr:hypothetical protein [Elusimicrobiota bacterium]